MSSNALALLGQGALIVIAKELTLRDIQAVFCCDKWLNERENNPTIWLSVDAALANLKGKREKRRCLENKIEEYNLGCDIKSALCLSYTFISSISRSLAFQYRLVAWWVRKLDLRDATLFLLCNATHKPEAVDPIIRASMELDRVCRRRGVTIHRSPYETLEERAEIGESVLLSKRSAVAMIGYWWRNKKPSAEFKRYLVDHKIPILFNHVSVPSKRNPESRSGYDVWRDERVMIDNEHDESLSSMVAIQHFLTSKEIAEWDVVADKDSRYMTETEAIVSMIPLLSSTYKGSKLVSRNMLIGDGVFLSSFSSAPVEMLAFEQINDESSWL